MTPDIERLEALLEKASGLPWYFDSYSRIGSEPIHRAEQAIVEPNNCEHDEPCDCPDYTNVAYLPVIAGDTATPMGYADAALIVEAVNALPSLIATIRAQQARIDALEARLEVVPGWSEDADGIACRDDTIKLQDATIRAQQARIDALEDGLRAIGICPEISTHQTMTMTTLTLTPL